jgi:hypothetical protein
LSFLIVITNKLYHRFKLCFVIYLRTLVQDRAEKSVSRPVVAMIGVVRKPCVMSFARRSFCRRENPSNIPVVRGTSVSDVTLSVTFVLKIFSHDKCMKWVRNLCLWWNPWPWGDFYYSYIFCYYNFHKTQTNLQIFSQVSSYMFS